MPVSKEILEPKDWSLDRKKAVLESRGIKTDIYLPNSQQEIDLINEEISKLNLKEVKQMSVSKEKSKKSEIDKIKLVCPDCKKNYFWQPREKPTEKRLEQIKKYSKCFDCRTKKVS